MTSKYLNFSCNRVKSLGGNDMNAAFGVTILILLSVVIWRESRRTERRQVLARTRKFFGNAVLITKKTSYWQRYLNKLQVQLNRIGIEIPVHKYSRYALLGAFVFVLVTHAFAHLPWTLAVTIAVLFLLFPQQIVAELSSRYVVKVRHRILVDVLKPGLHALHTGALNEVCAQIEVEAKSPVIRREFKFINELGQAPNMNVGQAMLIRAQALGIRELEILAKATIEGQTWNHKLTNVWSDVYKVLEKKVRTQNQIQAAVSIYRLIAICLFLAAVFVVVFAYPMLHIHGAVKLGVFVTLICYFIGISQVVKTKEVY